MGNMMKQIKDAEGYGEDAGRISGREVETSVGGGAVTVVANGRKRITSIKIEPEVVDPDDVEMLEDLVLAAINEALRKVEDMLSDEMGKLTGGMNIPGLF